MFENFARLYLFGDKSIGRATIQMADQDVIGDVFDEATGDLWECKNQKSRLAKSLIDKYVGVIGRKTTTGQAVRSINFLFPTHALAELNEAGLSGRGFKVWYVLQEGQELVDIPQDKPKEQEYPVYGEYEGKQLTRIVVEIADVIVVALAAGQRA